MAISVPHTKLGDLDVSTLTLGTWQFGDTLLYQKQTPEVEAQIVRNAFDVGINFFDTAEAYNDGVSEQALGNALKASGRERDEYVIATKVNGDNLSPERLRPIFERSLENLQTDHVDLLQIHWPNDQVPPAVYMPVIREFIEEGKVHAVGISNHGCHDMQTVLDTDVPIVSNQLPYNLLNRVVEDSILPFCQQRGIAVLAYSPLAQGLLTGKYTCVADCPPGLSRSRYFDKSRSSFSRHGEAGCEKELFDTLAALQRIAEAQQMTMSQLSLAWLRQRAPTSIIFGASKPEHVFINAECVNYHLTEEVMREIDACTLPVKECLHGNPDLWNAVSRVHCVVCFPHFLVLTCYCLFLCTTSLLFPFTTPLLFPFTTTGKKPLPQTRQIKSSIQSRVVVRLSVIATALPPNCEVISRGSHINSFVDSNAPSNENSDSR